MNDKEWKYWKFQHKSFKKLSFPWSRWCLKKPDKRYDLESHLISVIDSMWLLLVTLTTNSLLCDMMKTLWNGKCNDFLSIQVTWKFACVAYHVKILHNLLSSSLWTLLMKEIISREEKVALNILKLIFTVKSCFFAILK